MPLYEYTCKDCGSTFEQLIAARDRDSGVVCPDCGSKHVQRLICAFAIGKAATGSSSVSCPTCNLR